MRMEYLHYSCSLTVSLIAALYEFFFVKVSFIPYLLKKNKSLSTQEMAAMDFFFSEIFNSLYKIYDYNLIFIVHLLS